MLVGAGCHKSCRDVSTRSSRSRMSQLEFHSSLVQTQHILLNRPSGSEQIVPESRSELALGFMEPSLEVTGLKECSFLASRDNQHRETCLKNIIKDSLGSFGHRIALATPPG